MSDLGKSVHVLAYAHVASLLSLIDATCMAELGRPATDAEVTRGVQRLVSRVLKARRSVIPTEPETADWTAWDAYERED